MRIAIGADHAGFEYKDAVIQMLQQRKIDVTDFGTSNLLSTDYPIYAFRVAKAVQSKTVDYGILICGTGVGMSIAANKVRGIRAGVAQSDFAARAIKEHNDANVICLGSRTNSLEEVLSFIQIYLDTEFSGGERHSKRIHMISDYEEEQ